MEILNNFETRVIFAILKTQQLRRLNIIDCEMVQVQDEVLSVDLIILRYFLSSRRRKMKLPSYKTVASSVFAREFRVASCHKFITRLGPPATAVVLKARREDEGESIASRRDFLLSTHVAG